MKSFRFFFIFLFGIAVPLKAFSKAQVLYVDPKFAKAVPIYAADGKGKFTKRVTAVYPGEFVSLKETREIGGATWFIIKAKDDLGKDIELAIDPKSINYPDDSALYIAPVNAKKIKALSSGSAFSVETPGLDRETCFMKSATDSLCREVKPGEDIEVQDAVLALTSDGSDPSIKWRNYVQGSNGYWVNAQDTSGVAETFSSLENEGKTEDCEPESPYDELADVAEESAKLGSEKQRELIKKHIGQCHSMENTGNYKKKIVNAVAQQKGLPLLYKEMRMSDGSVQVVNANRSDWAAIDILARTLYGEMVSCFKHGLEYPKAVAQTVLNRVDFYNKHPVEGKRFIDPKNKEEYQNQITNSILKKWQFSIWNQAEPARRMVMCPPANPEENFWNGHKPGPEEQKYWDQAVKIASEAVLQGESFRKKNKDFKSLFYTTNYDMGPGFNPVDTATIAGKKINTSRCMQFWAETELKKKFPKFGDVFHPFFLEALTSVATINF